MADPTPADKRNVRREAIGNADDPDTLSDEDIEYYWSADGGESVMLTAALCCEMLAGRVGISVFRWNADGQSVDKTMQPAEWRRRAQALRRRAFPSGTLALSRQGATATADEFASEDE